MVHISRRYQKRSDSNASHFNVLAMVDQIRLKVPGKALAEAQQDDLLLDGFNCA